MYKLLYIINIMIYHFYNYLKFESKQKRIFMLANSHLLIFDFYNTCISTSINLHSNNLLF